MVRSFNLKKFLRFIILLGCAYCFGFIHGQYSTVKPTEFFTKAIKQVTQENAVEFFSIRLKSTNSVLHNPHVLLQRQKQNTRQLQKGYRYVLQADYDYNKWQGSEPSIQNGIIYTYRFGADGVLEIDFAIYGDALIECYFQPKTEKQEQENKQEDKQEDKQKNKENAHKEIIMNPINNTVLNEPI